jgi:type IV secretory pathway VirB10-like protein
VSHVAAILPPWLTLRQGRTTVGAVIRRSFRFGLTLGIVAGLAVALAKLLETRRAPDVAPTSSPPDPWPRLAPEPVATPAPTPAAPSAPTPPPAPAPAPTAPPAAQAAPSAPRKAPVKALWVEPKGDVCPTSHPVKAKLSSKIFHLPGMLNYDRTNPDRCYRDAEAAEGDGLRAAKR